MKKPITQGYLKGYYGYKNFGDELLALGVIRYLFAHYPLETLYIEVEDVDRFWTWLRRHESILGDLLYKVRLIAKSNKRDIIRYSILSPTIHKFLGGGEVFTPARGWFHGGRNVYILYRVDFIRHNITLLGGVSKANNRYFRLLYRLTLSKCDKIIVRESTTYTYLISTYVSKSKCILYNDFGHDIIDSQYMSKLSEYQSASKPRLQCPYLIVNANPHIDMSKLTEKLSILTNMSHFDTIVYFPGDKVDTILYDHLSTLFPGLNWTLFDWTKYDILTIMSVFRGASYGLGVRLHVLAMFKRLGVKFDYIVYQEKIDKFLHDQSQK